MLVKYFDGEIKDEFKGTCKINALETVKKVQEHFDKFEIQEAGAEIICLVDATNKYVAENAPWTLAKEGKMEECGQVLTNVLEIMCVVSALIYPFCPNIAKSMSNQLHFDLNIKLNELTLNNLKTGKLITKEEIKHVFLRLDSEFADKTKNK